jgi:hypothetical protein
MLNRKSLAVMKTILISLLACATIIYGAVSASVYRERLLKCEHFATALNVEYTFDEGCSLKIQGEFYPLEKLFPEKKEQLVYPIVTGNTGP